MSEKVMKQYRFILEPYKGISSRYTCPQCKRNRVFVRYIDTQHEYHFPDYVGKCNRENNCNYHLTPKEHFKDENIVIGDDIYAYESSQMFFPEVTHISTSVLEKSKRSYSTNHLFVYCSTLFGVAKTRELFNKYHVGSASYWQGATTFWQMDIEGKVRTGKVMLYNSITGRRVKHPYMLRRVEGECVNDLYSIMIQDSQKIKKIGMIIEDKQIDAILDKAILLIDEQKRDDERFNFNKNIGNHIEKILRAKLKEEFENKKKKQIVKKFVIQ